MATTTSPERSEGVAAPVGVFDSGVGGLSVLQELRIALPHEDFIYIADSAHCPYGGQPQPVVLARAEALTTELLRQGVKLITVACNTATVAAIDVLRSRHGLAFVGIEPAVKPAAALTRSGVIGVLSTRVTADGERVQSLIRRFAHGVQVLTQACPGLVARVEAGQLTDGETRRLVERYTTPLLAAGADTLVLGCTHYPFLRPLIADVVGPQIRLLDTGAAVARRVASVLQDTARLAVRERRGRVRWLTTGDAAVMSGIATRLLGEVVAAQRIGV
ncbi:MAG TPA: glutamate racemase [Nevskiaceae bacterium]|nr:glutamate racemase [Nevskiaceae bacterium]